jgi:hypothetical protein
MFGCQLRSRRINTFTAMFHQSKQLPNGHGFACGVVLTHHSSARLLDKGQCTADHGYMKELLRTNDITQSSCLPAFCGERT